MRILNIFSDTAIKVDAAKNLPHVDVDISNILAWVLGGAAIVAVIFIIKGGFNYVSSNGDPAKTRKALFTIIYSVIGLLIALFAEVIIAFVSSSASDAATSFITGLTLC